jgi:DNA-binding HxlR family transcriptional regulator
VGNGTSLSKDDLVHLKKVSKVFSEKWTLEIISVLLDGKAMGFNELIKKLDGISAAVLSHRLKSLQDWGYMTREVQPGPPTRTKYMLTNKGKNLMGIAEFVLQHK